jgi:hypothetical protein
MSWDAIITRGKEEADDQPVGSYAEVGKWLADFWQVDDFDRFVSNDGVRFEIMLRTSLDDERKNFLDSQPAGCQRAPDFPEILKSFDPKPTTPVTYISISVRAGADPLPSLKRFCAIHGLSLLDCQDGEYVDIHEKSPSENDSFSAWRRYRDSLLGE